MTDAAHDRTLSSPGPWRLGGDCRLGTPDSDKEWVELPTGRAIWDANNQPVILLREWFDADALELAAAAPALLRLLKGAVACGREGFGHRGRPGCVGCTLLAEADALINTLPEIP
jgi:hypothetical protein